MKLLDYLAYWQREPIGEIYKALSIPGIRFLDSLESRGNKIRAYRRKMVMSQMLPENYLE